MKQSNQKGGLFSKTEEFIKLLKKAKKSENDYIKSYGKHVKAAINHAKMAEIHTANLKAIDSVMPNGFDSFLQVFNKTVSPELRLKKKPDTSSPLLLRNYNLENVADKDDLARDHLWHQCHYVLKTKFAPQDAVLVTKLNIADHNKSTFTMAITGVSFGKDSRRTISHNNYNANLAEIRTNLADVISNIKKDVMEQVIQENVFAAPINNAPQPVPMGTGFAKKQEKKDPIPDIYGVSPLLNSPKIQQTKPQFGDNKAEFGNKKPDFGGTPDYLKQTPIIVDKPPKPVIEEKENNAPPIDAPDDDFMKRHKPKNEFGEFGKQRDFKKPREGNSGQKRNFSKKRDSGSRKGSFKGNKYGRPNFRERKKGSHRRSNRFRGRHSKKSQKRDGSRKHNRGPPPPPPDL